MGQTPALNLLVLVIIRIVAMFNKQSYSHTAPCSSHLSHHSQRQTIVKIKFNIILTQVFNNLEWIFTGVIGDEFRRAIQALIVLCLPVGLYALGLAGIDLLATTTNLAAIAVLAAVLAAADRAQIAAIGAIAVAGGLALGRYSELSVVVFAIGAIVFLAGGVHNVVQRFRSIGVA